MGQLLVFVVKFFAPFVDDVVNVADGYAAVGFAVDHADRGQAAAADALDIAGVVELAQLIEGLPVDDPTAYAEAVCSLMK